jgi:hypothetical protein
VGDRGAIPIAGLTKRDVEHLLAAFDHDPVAALADALRRVLDQPSLDWPELLACAAERRLLTGGERDALLGGDLGALDQLAGELNELRGLGRR